MGETNREKELRIKREYWARLSPERKAEIAAKRRDKYNNDPDYRARIKDKEDRRRAQPGYKDYAREMYRKYRQKARTDPDYRAREKKRYVKFYASVKGTASSLVAAARNRKKAVKLGFDLTKDWVEGQLASGVCPKTGWEFTYRTPSEVGARVDRTRPSLDRVNSEAGYTKNNVQVVCTAYNVAKQEVSDQDFLELCKAVVTTAGYVITKGP